MNYVYKTYIKRFLDILLSFAGIIVLWIPMLVVAIIIKCEDKGPVLFKQKRIGKDKTTFNIYKFRSMKMSTPENMPTHLLSNPEQYILKSGSWLRKYSIDEIPQLFNIIKGEMSIVGPRPALWNQYDLIKERDLYNANSIRPGLTGWAQVNGRDELDIKEKAFLDGEYVKNESFIFDLKCFLLTIIKVFKHEGVVEGGARSTENKPTDE